MKQEAYITDWWRFGDSLMGTIIGHPRQSEFVEKYQRTSRIVCFDSEKGICETRNTVYTLGGHHSDYTDIVV